MRNVTIVSTDDEFQQRAATTQPYNLAEVVVTTSNQPCRLEDGCSEYAEPTIETSDTWIPGRELRESTVAYNRRVEEFKRENPDLLIWWIRRLRFPSSCQTRF